MMIYASHLIFQVRKWTPPLVRQPFSVRVMIPCYKEDIETLEETVECAVEAAKAAMAKGQANAGEALCCSCRQAAPVLLLSPVQLSVDAGTVLQLQASNLSCWA